MMSDFNRLKAIIEDATKQRKMIRSRMLEFEVLQKEITRLHERSGVDPDARKKLAMLDELMTGDGKRLQEQIVAKVAKAERSLKKLAGELELSLPSNGSFIQGETPPEKRAVKKNRISRNFV